MSNPSLVSDFITDHLDVQVDYSDNLHLDFLESALLLFEQEASNAAVQRVLKRLRVTYGDPEKQECD